MDGTGDTLPTATRVSDPGMRALYRLENRWQAWLDVEAALARAQAELDVHGDHRRCEREQPLLTRLGELLAPEDGVAEAHQRPVLRRIDRRLTRPSASVARRC